MQTTEPKPIKIKLLEPVIIYQFFTLVSDMCSSIHSASHLLGLEDSCLKQLLTTRQISTQLSGRRRPTIYRKSAGSIEECNTRRDCIMRFLYEQMFLWIVSIINTKVRVENSSLKQLGQLANTERSI